MVAVELLVVLLFIFLGARIGGIGIGFAGGAGVIALSLILGVPTSQAYIPAGPEPIITTFSTFEVFSLFSIYMLISLLIIINKPK